MSNEKLNFRSQFYHFMLTPSVILVAIASAYGAFVSALFGIGWTGPEGDQE